MCTLIPKFKKYENRPLELSRMCILAKISVLYPPEFWVMCKSTP